MSTLSIPAPQRPTDSSPTSTPVSTSSSAPPSRPSGRAPTSTSRPCSTSTTASRSRCRPRSSPSSERLAASAQTKVKPEAAPKPAPRTVRLTRRGRVVIVLAFLGLALALMVPIGGWATATLTGGTPEPVRIVEVQPGDTLYGIAGDLAKPGHDPRDGAPHPGAQLAARWPDHRRPEARRPPRLSLRRCGKARTAHDVTTTHSTRVVGTGEEVGWDRTPVPPHSPSARATLAGRAGRSLQSTRLRPGRRPR